MKTITKHIPNALTCSNLICGCLGIIFVFQNKLTWSSYLIGIAAIIDFLDGFVARLLKVHSEIGKQLDSLADMVTFGVLPGLIMFQIMKLNGYGDQNTMSVIAGWHTTKYNSQTFLPFIALLIPVFSALRLAKFNIDTRQSDSFIGLPTPANTLLIASLPLIYKNVFSGGWTVYPPLSMLPDTITSVTFAGQCLSNNYLLAGLCVVMSFLLVCNLPLFALKFKNFTWADNKIRYIFLGLSLMLLIILKYEAIPLIILLYIILSVIDNLSLKEKNI